MFTHTSHVDNKISFRVIKKKFLEKSNHISSKLNSETRKNDFFYWSWDIPLPLNLSIDLEKKMFRQAYEEFKIITTFVSTGISI